MNKGIKEQLEMIWCEEEKVIQERKYVSKEEAKNWVNEKACPFCGSDDLRISKNIESENGYIIAKATKVECLTCGVDGPKIAFVEDVLKAWNDRK